MAKIKTTELVGAALDLAVAMAEGVDAVLWANEGALENAACVLRLSIDCSYPSFFQPSTDWLKGGPIIERKGINLFQFRAEYKPGTAEGHPADWIAHWDGLYQHRAETPLVAAMRCYVAYTLGAVVEIPDALLNGGA